MKYLCLGYSCEVQEYNAILEQAREGLWLERRKTLKDRAREECIERVKSFEQTFHPIDDKQRALDEIYVRAEMELGDA